MAMQPMTRLTIQVEALDRELHLLRVQLHDNTWDPDELGCIRDEIDALLDRRLALSG